MDQGGKTSNASKRIQKFVETVLEEKGYKQVPNNRFNVAKYLDQPIYSKQVLIGESIYETRLFGDFILYHPEKLPNCLVIEAHWQESAGSVDVKYPYYVLNINMKSPFETIIILDGGGYTPGAEKWIKSQVGNKLKKVFSMTEFQVWANKGNI